MANGDEELDQQAGQGADELDAPEVGEQDARGDSLREHEQTLGDLIARGEAAGYAAETHALRRARKALKNTRQQIEAAEQRAYQKALQEFANGDGQQAVEAIRGQVRAELQQETARERSLARLGIPADSPVRGLFDGVSGDHRAFERHADLLHAAGVSWGDSDPLVRQVARQRVAAWQQQAQENGNGTVPLDPAAGVPAAVQEQVIRQQVEAMQAGQAGGQTVGADSLEDEIRRADPERLGQAGVEALAARFNRDLDAISRQMSGGPL